MAPTQSDLAAALAAISAELAQRFLDGDEHGAAALLLADGRILTGTARVAVNAAVELCHEVRPYCEAFRLDQPVVASVCLFRDAEGAFRVLSPCGVCLERLAVHGRDVLVAVPDELPAVEIRWVKLRDALPHYWLAAFPEQIGEW